MEANRRDQIIETLVRLVFRLSNELVTIQGANPNDLWPLHPDRPGTEQFKTAKPIAHEIVALVKKHNGDMLSDHVILSKLIYGAAAIRLQMNIPDKELEELATRGARDLLDYKATREVDVPIFSLELGGRPFTFGPVTFHPITPDDKETDWWKWAKSSLEESVDTLFLSYARTSVPGDVPKSVANAAITVSESLLLLRGIGFPLVSQERHQFGILNEYPLWKNVHYRLGRPKETTRVDAQSHLVTTIGPFRFPYDLHEDILSNITPERLEALRSLVAQTGFSPAPEMRARLLSGLRWLGEASKPDALAARFAKLAFSLEAFIGGDPKDDSLTTKGITAALAERAAFLLSDDLETRLKTDRDVRRFYAMRSGIAHGRGSTVQPSDFQEFGALVRQVAFSLIDKLGLFGSIDDLQRWLTVQRYSLVKPHDADTSQA